MSKKRRQFKGRKKKVEADSARYERNGKEKKKRVTLRFNKSENKEYYTFISAFEADADKPFYGAKVEKDGLTCAVTVELDGKAPGLPIGATLNPSSAWQQHSRRPVTGDDITPDSNVKVVDIDFEFLRKAKHPDVETGARIRGNGNFSASLTGGKNLAAVHSLNAEKFLAAVELGGMPMPSVAVTRLDGPYEWGGSGDINLIGKPEMVDPRKKSKVYLYDAYAGMMPPVMYRKKNTEGALKLKADALEKQYGTQTHGMRVCISWDYEGKRTMRQ